MSNRPKYVKFSVSGIDEPQYILFDQWQDHDIAFRNVIHSFPGSVKVEAISAGFVTLNQDADTGLMALEAHGKSYTLDLGSENGDGTLLTRYIEEGLQCALFGNENWPSFLSSSLPLVQFIDTFFNEDILFLGKIRLSGVKQSITTEILEAEIDMSITNIDEKFWRCLIYNNEPKLGW